MTRHEPKLKLAKTRLVMTGFFSLKIKQTLLPSTILKVLKFRLDLVCDTKYDTK